MAVDDRARLQRRRRRAARGGHRRRQVARLSRARAALGGGERRAHDRVDEHDQPAGAARRQGSAVSRDGAHRPEGALRAAQGLAQLPLPVAARAGARSAQRAVRRRHGAASSTAIAAWAERTTRRLARAICRRRRAPRCGTRSSAEPDLCTRLKCPLFEKCFLFKARRAAAQADVIVVNHHLLLSDLAVRRASQNWDDAAVLPAYRRLVVDEGHHLEDAAAAHLGSDGDAPLAAAARSIGSTGAARDCCPRSSTRLSASNGSAEHREPRPRPGAARAGGARGCARRARCCSICSTRSSRRAGEPVVRLTRRLRDASDLEGRPARRARGHARRDRAAARRACSSCASASRGARKLDEALAPLLNEMRAVTRRLQAAGDGLRRALDSAAGRRQRALDRGARTRARRWPSSSVPLDLAPILREDLFKRLDSTIVTSATLTASRRRRDATRTASTFSPRGSASTIRSSSRRRRSSRRRSTIAAQALLAIPTDVPAPNVDAAGHRQRRRRASTLDRRRGVGRRHVRAVHEPSRRARDGDRAARARHRSGAGRCSCTATRARDALLARFRDVGQAILLGTASFWEGVDVPGDALRGARHRQAALPRADRADHGGALRGDRGARRRRVRGVHAAARRRCG